MKKPPALRRGAWGLGGDDYTFDAFLLGLFDHVLRAFGSPDWEGDDEVCDLCHFGISLWPSAPTKPRPICGEPFDRKPVFGGEPFAQLISAPRTTGHDDDLAVWPFGANESDGIANGFTEEGVILEVAAAADDDFEGVHVICSFVVYWSVMGPL